jgi:hypothetical protein
MKSGGVDGIGGTDGTGGIANSHPVRGALPATVLVLVLAIAYLVQSGQ